MRFLTEEDALHVRRHFKSRDVDAPRKARMTYETGPHSYRRLAGPIVEEFGNFDEAMLWIENAVFGDSYHEGEIENPLWRDYYHWRGLHGDDRRVMEAPGCVVDGKEGKLLAEAITYAIMLACDAHLMVRPGRTLLKISHADHIDIISGVNARKIIARLQKLGCKVAP
ncbi:MAG: hypothetical protein R3D57_15130 [Hyphomicrobiaceae bacterium]